jgi:hypothetical protein
MKKRIKEKANAFLELHNTACRGALALMKLKFKIVQIVPDCKKG